MSAATSDNDPASSNSLVASVASGLFKTPDGKTLEIRDVWASNFEEEMDNIRESVMLYPCIAMVRFP